MDKTTEQNHQLIIKKLKARENQGTKVGFQSFSVFKQAADLT